MFLGVIIAAGGTGSRMRAGSSKQFLELAGMPVIARSVAIFNPLEAVQEIVIAIDEDDVDKCLEVVGSYKFTKVTSVVKGGEHRALSVKNALKALGAAVDTIAVHDGARPLFPGQLLEGGLEILQAGGCEGVVFGVPVTDTIKEADTDSLVVSSTADRTRLWMAQTPQIFTREAIEKAFESPPEILRSATDDSFLVERSGGRVKMVPGSRENIKLTEPFDLLVAEEILKRRESSS